MSKKISGAEYPLSKVFSSDFEFTIPSYQRPYSWGVDQASELFEDLFDFYTREKDDTYFLGSIVLIKDENKPKSEVIDGQQRLTTLTIFLSCLAHLAPGATRESLRKYICEPGDEIENLPSKPRLALRERDRLFFESTIQSLEFDALLAQDPAQLDNESQRNIMANAKYLLGKIQSKLDDGPEFIKAFSSFLVMRCFLVVVSTPSQQSAFRVFSVLNSRGLDLLPTDIIKSDIIGKIPSSKQDDSTERWEELEVQTTRNGFAELFGHIRMIYAKTKSKRALLDEFREHVLAVAPKPEEIIEKVIEPYAEAFLIAKKCEFFSTENAREINSLLHWLNRIDNSDWLPSAIKFLAEKKNQHAYVCWFMERLERLAAYLHLCEKNVNERIERYATVLSALEKDHSLDAPVTAIELSNDEIDEFHAALDGNIYELTARRRNYLILRLDSFLADGAATYDPALLTIEHVLPQTVNPDTNWSVLWPDARLRKEWVHRLSNLVPLTQKRNSKAQNFDFDTKKTAYFGGKSGVSSYVLTTQVLATQSWTPEVVQMRQSELLDTLATNWNLKHA